MKIKYITPFLLFPALSGCANPFPVDDEALLLDAGFVFEHFENEENEKIASLLFNGGYYSFPNEIKIDKILVAGDQLSITFNGDYSVICQEIYPSKCVVEGEVKSYTLIETRVRSIHIDAATIKDIANEFKKSYILDNEYVIFDQEGIYTTLDSYEVHDLWLSENKRNMTELNTCLEGAQCEPSSIYIAGLYAYDPR